MANLKQTVSDIMREAAHNLAEITSEASKALSKQTAASLAGIQTVVNAGATLPVNTGELLSLATVALVGGVRGRHREEDAARARGGSPVDPLAGDRGEDLLSGSDGRLPPLQPQSAGRHPAAGWEVPGGAAHPPDQGVAVQGSGWSIRKAPRHVSTVKSARAERSPE